MSKVIPTPDGVKRPRGEGIRRLPNGGYYATVNLRLPNGVRHAATKTLPTLKAAREWRAAKLADRERQRQGKASPEWLSDALARWYPHYSATPGIGPRTVQDALDTLRRAGLLTDGAAPATGCRLSRIKLSELTKAEPPGGA